MEEDIRKFKLIQYREMIHLDWQKNQYMNFSLLCLDEVLSTHNVQHAFVHHAIKEFRHYVLGKSTVKRCKETISKVKEIVTSMKNESEVMVYQTILAALETSLASGHAVHCANYFLTLGSYKEGTYSKQAHEQSLYTLKKFIEMVEEGV